MSDAEKSVMSNVRALLKRRRADDAQLSRDSDLYGELELDSLEVAELSVALEDELGSDPYSQGLVPRTIGEVVDFYQQ